MKNFINRMKHNFFQYLLLVLVLFIVFTSLIIVNQKQVKAYDKYQKEVELVKEFEDNNSDYNLVDIKLNKAKLNDDLYYNDGYTYNSELFDNNPVDYNELSEELLENMATSSYLEKTVKTAHISVNVENMYEVGRDKEEQDSMKNIEIKTIDGEAIEKNRHPNAHLFATNNDDISREFEFGYRTIIKGEKPINLNECIISQRYAEFNNLSIGDSVIISRSGRGDAVSHSLVISGIYSDSSKMMKENEAYQLNSIKQTKKTDYSIGDNIDVDNTIIIHMETMNNMKLYQESEFGDIERISEEQSSYINYPLKENLLFFVNDNKNINDLENDFHQKGLSGYYDVNLVKYNIKSELNISSEVKSPISTNSIYTIVGGLIAIIFVSLIVVMMESKSLKIKVYHGSQRKLLIQQGIIDFLIVTILGLFITFGILVLTGNRLFHLQWGQISLLFFGIALFQLFVYEIIRIVYITRFKPSQYLASKISDEKHTNNDEVVMKNGKSLLMILLVVSVLIVGMSTIFTNLDAAGVVKKAETENTDEHPYTIATEIIKDNLVSIDLDAKMMEELGLENYLYSGTLPKVTTKDYKSFVNSEYVDSYNYFLYMPVFVEDYNPIMDPDELDPEIYGWGNTVYASDTSSISDEFDDGIRKIIEGEVFKESNECIISDKYAELNSLKVGDTLEISDEFYGINNKTLTITGIYTDSTPDDAPYWRRYSNNQNIINQVLDHNLLLYSENAPRPRTDIHSNDIYVSYETIQNLPMFEIRSVNEISIYLKDANTVNLYEEELNKKGLPQYYDVKLQKEVEYEVSYDEMSKMRDDIGFRFRRYNLYESYYDFYDDYSIYYDYYEGDYYNYSYSQLYEDDQGDNDFSKFHNRKLKEKVDQNPNY